MTPRDGAPTCDHCGGPILGRRQGTRYCSDSCRQAASRARRGLSHGWGDAGQRKARRAAVAGRISVTGQ